MRMWMINPKFLCRYHLLGEHKELHMLVGALNKGKNLKGYFDKNQIAIHYIIPRHEELVKEFIRRGYNHKSPLPEFNVYIKGKIDLLYNLQDLQNRCSTCQKLQKNYKPIEILYMRKNG